MKFLCPACDRLAEIDAFRVDAGALRLRCTKCGVESTHGTPAPATPARPTPPVAPPAAAMAASGVPAAAAEPKVVLLRAASSGGATMPAAVEDPFTAPPGFCPKCIAPRGPGPSCAQCGLVFVVYKGSDALPPPPVAEGWRDVLAHWQEGPAHDQFIRQAMALGALPAAARLYRIQLAHNPEDPFAARGREEIVRLATAATPLTPSSPPRGGQAVKPWQVVLAVVGVLLFALALVSVLRGVVAVGP